MKHFWETIFLMGGDVCVGAEGRWDGISEIYGARSSGSFKAQLDACCGVLKTHTEVYRNLLDNPVSWSSSRAQRNAFQRYQTEKATRNTSSSLFTHPIGYIFKTYFKDDGFSLASHHRVLNASHSWPQNPSGILDTHSASLSCWNQLLAV